MAIAFVAVTSIDTTGNTVSLSHTISAGSDRCLVVCFGADYFSSADPAYNVYSATFNGIALTRAVENFFAIDANNGVVSQIWYLLNPPVGTFNVEMTIGTSTSVFKVTALSYTGVVAAPEATALINTTIPNPTSLSTTITTLTSNALVVNSCGGYNAGAGPMDPTANETERSELLDNFRSAATADQITTLAGAKTVGWTNPSEWAGLTMVAASFPSEFSGNAIFYGMAF